MPEPITERFELRDDGAMHRRDVPRWKGMIERMELFGGGTLEVEFRRPKRSNSANRYLWGIVYREIRKALRDAGRTYSAEHLHEHFKALYLEPRIIEVEGTTHVLPPSTARLDSTAFHDYIEAIKQDEMVLALEIEFPEPEGLPRPDPHEAADRARAEAEDAEHMRMDYIQSMFDTEAA